MPADASDTPLLDLLSTMTTASIDASALDETTFLLVRLAALVAVDAPPASYLMNLAAAAEAGLDEAAVRDVLIAVAPIVGTARVVSAVGKVGRALGLALDVVDLAEEDADASRS